MFFYTFIVSYVKLRRKLSVVVPLRDNIFVADDIKSPFVVGLFRPKIYLPCNLGDKEQEYIPLFGCVEVYAAGGNPPVVSGC